MAAVNEVLVPDIGDFTDVPVIEVLVKEGDEVAENDPLIVLESEKATLDVPSPVAGVVGKVAVAVGDKVTQGDLILTFAGGDDGDDTESADADEETDADADAAAAADGDEPEDDSDAGADDARDGGDEAADDADAEAEPADEDQAEDEDDDGADDADASPSVEETGDSDAAPRRSSGQIHAGPAARRAARELGIDIGEVAGTGRAGRITLEDVATAAREGGQGAAADGAAGGGGAAIDGLPAWPKVDFAAFGEVERVDLSRITRIAGPHLARNWIMIPHVTQFDEADITDLEAFRKRVNEEHAAENVRVTMVSLLIKACTVALREFPHFNASLDGDGLILKRYFNIGFAVDTPGGLMVPVIRDADRKGLLGIARELTELSGAARDGSITREAMQGGSFTISSLGGIGGTAFTPIINAPEVAILGASRAVMRPVWDGRAFAPRLMLPLSLSYDHRVIDGAAGARFTQRLARLLSDPSEMLL